MFRTDFIQAVKEIMTRDTRYEEGAYVFVRETLDYTSKTLKKPEDGPGRHVSGKELLDGMRTFCLEQFGPMAYTVLTAWGIKCTQDFGNIVFNMVEAGILGKTDSDTIADFVDGYDFKDAFEKPYLPAKPKARRAGSKAGKPGKRKPSTRKKTDP